MYQTYYAGGREEIEVRTPDGRVEMEKRPCMTLEAHSAWDRSIPVAYRVHENGSNPNGPDDEAERLVWKMW